MAQNSIEVHEGCVRVTIVESFCGGKATFAAFEPQQLVLLCGAGAFSIHLVRSGCVVELLFAAADSGHEQEVIFTVPSAWWDVHKENFNTILDLSVGDYAMVAGRVYRVSTVATHTRHHATVRRGIRDRGQVPDGGNLSVRHDVV